MNNPFYLRVTSEESACIRVFSSPEETVEYTPILTKTSDGKRQSLFSLEKGRYLIRLEQKDCYTVEQCTEVEADTALSLFSSPREERGFEPKEEAKIFSHKKEAWDRIAPNWDSRWEPYRVIFKTPYFQRERNTVGAFRTTSHEELLAFLNKHEKTNPYLSLFSLGKTAVYGLEIPLAVFSEDLPPNLSSPEEAGAILQKSTKPVVYYQAQIHGNEPGGGEGALAVISYLSTPQGQALLKKLHLVILPRVNPDGALLFRRTNALGADLNRDFFPLRHRETQAAVRAFRAFSPCLVLDGHEYNGNKKKSGRILRYDDIQVSAGTAPNSDPELMERNHSLLFRAQEELKHVGLTGFFYRDHISGSEIATATRYFAERGAATVLIESRGIHLGTARFPRRVMGQFTVVRSCLETVAENAASFLQIAQRERKHFEHPFDRDFVLEGAYTDHSETDPVYPLPFYDTETGERVKTDERIIPVFRIPVRTRPRPKAYVLPLGCVWEKTILTWLERQKVQFFLKEAGTSLSLRGYEKTEERYRLTDEHSVSFPNGAVEIPLSQEACHLISFLLEPDCADSEEAKKKLKANALLFPETTYEVYRKEL